MAAAVHPAGVGVSVPLVIAVVLVVLLPVGMVRLVEAVERRLAAGRWHKEPPSVAAEGGESDSRRAAGR